MKRLFVKSTMIIVLSIFCFLFIGCELTFNNSVKNVMYDEQLTDFEIKSVSSYDELNKLVVDNQKFRDNDMLLWNGYLAIEGATIDSTSIPKSATETNKTENIEASKTNVQVEGVDEEDIVKNDKRFIYITNYKNLTVFDTVTDEIKVYTFDGFRPNQMYLTEDRLIILGTKRTKIENGLDDYFGWYCRYYQQEEMQIKIFDRSENGIDLKLVREMNFPSTYYVSSRMIENNLYLVLRKYNSYDYNTKKYLPINYYDSLMGDEVQELGCENIYILGGVDSYGYNLLVGLDVAKEEKANIDAYIGRFDYIYASVDNFYVANSIYYTYVYEDNQEDPDNKIGKFVYLNKTIIYRFKYEGTKLVYQAYNSCDGNIKDQFSMDEYNGYFRIATTKYEPKKESFIYAFNINGNKKFSFVSSVGGLGVGENLYSVRFDKDVCSVVTAVTVDPLYRVDLSDPSNIIVTSELKVAGVSDYLQQINEDLLIGIGRSTKESKWGSMISTGSKISLFNVKDEYNTFEADVYEIANGYSEISYNHKILLSLPSQNIYAYPITTTEGYTNLYVFKIDIIEEKINLLGIISHKDLEANNINQYESSIARGVIIGNKIYTISRNFIAISTLETDLKIEKYYNIYEPNDVILSK